MQYTDIFQKKKNENFIGKKNIFNISAQNMDCGCTLAVLTSTHNLCFISKIKKYTPVNPSFAIKWGMNVYRV